MKQRLTNCKNGTIVILILIVCQIKQRQQKKHIVKKDSLKTHRILTLLTCSYESICMLCTMWSLLQISFRH